MTPAQCLRIKCLSTTHCERDYSLNFDAMLLWPRCQTDNHYQPEKCVSLELTVRHPGIGLEEAGFKVKTGASQLKN
jgi:hypothetical protein